MVFPHPVSPIARTASAQEGSCMAAHTRLNTDTFDLICRAAQLTSGPNGTGRVSNAKIAEFLGNGIAENTVRRIRSGERAPGGAFIAAALESFRPWDVRFEQVFITEVDDESGEDAA